MDGFGKRGCLALAAATVVLFFPAGASAQNSMASGANGYQVSNPIFTIGETVNGYTPPGVLDGMGAMRLNHRKVRVFVNHELLNNRGYEYQVGDGAGGSFGLLGARISFFDIDRKTLQVVDAGPAVSKIYANDGTVAEDPSFLANNFSGLSRLCSSQLVPAKQFGFLFWRRGLRNSIYFTGEEDGGSFNGVGGNEWALDVRNGNLWAVPAMGRGAWENITEIDSGRSDTVAFLLSDDTSPFDVDNDGVDEAAPLFLYVGKKQKHGNFLAKNGLADGKLYVFVADNGATSPLDFRGSGMLEGRWEEVDNRPVGPPSEDGSTGYGPYGYPVQRNLWSQAEALGAFGFSRPEDLATCPFPFFGNVAVFASTGVDTFAVGSSGDGVDTFGTTYIVKTDVGNLTGSISILYDGDADPSRALRSPDNLDWADDGYIYVQEDKAETDTLAGEVLFGPGAANPNEAGIVRINPFSGNLLRVANIDRNVVLDGSINNPADAVDTDAGVVGAWESSGIIDVSKEFGRRAGTLFLFNVQAHGIEDQDQFNGDSRIVDSDLVEGGQLLFLKK